MNPLGLVQPRSYETCWMAKQGLQEITGWAGREGNDPVLDFLQLKNSLLLFGK